MTWEQLQEELFEQLFKTEEEYITLRELLKLIEPISKVWTGLEKILIDDRSNRFDFWRSIARIKFLDGYIIIKTGLRKYMVIDPIDKTCLTDEECKILFGKEFFLTNFDESNSENGFIDTYHFENAGKQETIDSLIEYINNNQDILTKENRIYHSIDYLNSRVAVSIRMGKQNATINFATFTKDKDQPSINCLFFDKEAKLTGASNPTNNHESLLAMGNRGYAVKIPVSVIPKFVKGEKSQQLTYKPE